jgi:hypothetical protein
MGNTISHSYNITLKKRHSERCGGYGTGVTEKSGRIDERR